MEHKEFTMRRFFARFLVICAIAFCAGGGVVVDDAAAGYKKYIIVCHPEGHCKRI